MEFKSEPVPYSSLLANKILASLYVENGEATGIQFETNQEIIQRPGGSTDMGNVSKVVPSLYPKYSIGTDASLHSKDFASHASEVGFW